MRTVLKALSSRTNSDIKKFQYFRQLGKTKTHQKSSTHPCHNPKQQNEENELNDTLSLVATPSSRHPNHRHRNPRDECVNSVNYKRQGESDREFPLNPRIWDIGVNTGLTFCGSFSLALLEGLVFLSLPCRPFVWDTCTVQSHRLRATDRCIHETAASVGSKDLRAWKDRARCPGQRRSQRL